MSALGVKISFICLVAILGSSANASPADAISRIVGGSPITIYKAPYTVQFRNKHSGWITCTGTLVSPRFVVTAAHCFGSVDFNDVVVVGGVSTLSDRGVERRIVDMIVHPRYHPATLHTDLAVLKLDSDMRGANIQTVPLCRRPLKAGDYLQVSGWGLTDNDGQMSHQLRTVRLQIIPENQCKVQHWEGATNGICAFIPGIKSACMGDSGGPAINNGELCGVVAFGKECGSKEYASVFTDVYKLRDFIQKFMRS